MLLPFVVLAWLTEPVVVASKKHNSTCGDIYYPSSLRPTSARFTVVTAGLTGTGKSTLVDMLAGGHEMSAVGSVNGDSETEAACTYHFEFMGGTDLVVGHEQWKALDTPGFDDTGGKFKIVDNDFVVEHALRKTGAVDAIILAWKYDEKFTDANLGAFTELRSTFGISAWKRVIVVYTFWHWEECVEFLCDCKTRSDLAKVHQQTMDAAFHQISRLAGDLRCNETITRNCFPEAKDIPFIGSDLTLANLKRMRQLGCDPLAEPEASSGTCTETCPVNSAGDIRSLRPVLEKITTASGYQQIDTSRLTNSWASCEKASYNLQFMLKQCTNASLCADGSPNTKFYSSFDIVANHTALQLQHCLRGGITSETAKVSAILHGRSDLQANVAFFMTDKKYVAAPVFSTEIVEIVNAYPDFHTYKTCKVAADLNTQDATVLTDSATMCWTRLASAEGRPREPAFNKSIMILIDSYRNRSSSLTMAVSMNMIQCRNQAPSHCPSAVFTSLVSTKEELRQMEIYRAASEDRCCHRKGETWTARTGTCDNSRFMWNQTTIQCLQSCSRRDLRVPHCSVKPDGAVSGDFKDALGRLRVLNGTFLADAFTPNGGAIELHWDVPVSFVMEATMKAQCHEAKWQYAVWELPPKARQLRNCSVCHTTSECLSGNCLPGLGLENKLWLAGDSEDSELCSNPSVCGAQQDAQCAERPACSSQSGVFFESRDCSSNSCNFDDCCGKLGTCDGVCRCPYKAKQLQPAHCRGPTCEISECCEKDPKIETCSRATGGTCAVLPCNSWRGDTECVKVGRGVQSAVDRLCLCKPGSCARNYGYKTGYCSDKCWHPEDCGPETGGYCDKTLATFKVNTCAHWRGDTYCRAGRCICANNCASAYGEDKGNCNNWMPGMPAELASSGSRLEFMTPLVASIMSGLLATLSCMLLVRQRYLRSTKLSDPLLRRDCSEDVQ